MRALPAYGRGTLRVELPSSCLVDVLERRPVAPLADPVRAPREALERPLGAPALRELARPLRVAQHDTRDAASHADFGRTASSSRSRADGVARALATAPAAARVAALPRGPYVLATVRGARRPLGRGLPWGIPASPAGV